MRPSDSDDESIALRADLAAERERNDELEAQLRWTQDQLSQLAVAARSGSEAAAPSAAAGREDQSAEAPTGSWFASDELAERGLADHEIERLKRAAEAAQLATLELQHAARRNGTLGTVAYRKQYSVLDAKVRRELGDEDYDFLLYATGRKNRVVVASVMAGSAAAQAGIEAGDKILRYDDRRIFFGTELQRRVAKAERGRSVPIQVKRGNRTLHLGLPAGPIGIRLQAGSDWPGGVR